MPSLAQQKPTGLSECLLKKIQASIYESIASFKIDIWRSREPLPFAQRTHGEYRIGNVGAPWAEALFDCAWICFSTQLPPLPEGTALVARIDINGELCVVDDAGTPLRGLTNVKSTFDPRLGGPAKTVYALPERCRETGQVALWADAGFNDLFGFLKDDGRIAMAEVALVRENVRQLYYDVETLRDYLLALPPEDPKAADIERALADIAPELDCACEASVQAARARLEHWFSPANPASRLLVHAIGHAHIDLAWLWPLRETVRKGARTFASALYNIERYPEYVFGASQPQLFAWMKDRYPALYARIKAAVKAGRIEPQGTFWVEPDCNIPNGESFVRQILHGRRFFETEFGSAPDYCWEPDVFGYHGQLPQILRKSGHRYFMTQKLSWNMVNRFPHHSFHWQGIDNSDILAHMLPEETYNGPAAARSLLKIDAEYAQKNVSNHALMAFGIGDGGGGPDAEHLERLRRAPLLPGMPRVRIESAQKFFRTWALESQAFPTWRGELYLERHQGTLTTQALAKRNNRRCEIALREVEWASCVAQCALGIPYPAEALDRIWKEVLLYQFHDILPGSSIKRVYHECNARYAVLLDELHALAAQRLQALAQAAAKDNPGIHGTRPFAVFNTLAWPRREWILLEGAWQAVSVPAGGWTLCDANAHADPIPNALFVGEGVLENEYLKVRFSPEGHICSILDKNSGREFIGSGGRANDWCVIEDLGDAWDFETDAASKDVWRYLRRPVARPALTGCVFRIEGPHAQVTQTWRHSRSQICQRIRLTSGSRQIEFDSDIDWRESAAMLRVRFDTAVESDEAAFEIPFGHIRRSTREDTSEQRAQIETAAQQWVDLSQKDFGVALYNDCKYGFRIKGRVIDMAVLRSVPHPGAPLINKDDASQTPSANFTDLGKHRVRYALRPHAQVADEAAFTREARAFNTPLRAVSADAQGQALRTPAREKLFAKGSWLHAENPHIEMAALKRSEDGEGYVLRLVNLTGGEVETALHTPAALGEWEECDLLESPLQTPENVKLDTLRFKPFEIKTLRTQRR